VRREFLRLLPGLLVSGCGYALVGRGVTTDPSIRRIGVPQFKDLTGKATLDQKVTHKIIEELFKRGRFDVVPDDKGVDATVEGELTAYTVTPVGFTGGALVQSQASRYMIRLTARVRYSKVGAKEPIWSNDAFTFSDEYDVGDAVNFFDREEQAIDRLVANFARALVAAMLEAF
jgi:hypothetical protein